MGKWSDRGLLTEEQERRIERFQRVVNKACGVVLVVAVLLWAVASCGQWLLGG